ncbi:PLP-dependent cysteine synthase family protein [Streptomyces sp. H27-H1]|uniref:PLP-dependent cysteine synthase family protein n=1 Tax=Streptomyces sp. H27-H1 TaxID=2996461 RepID=UPI002270C4BE|nr:PLP-dependent cysteine synthase family protein [Streptomyces sp. H27-H1]MCY0929405.1 PLP-dependent cysteine synthase family protein [Streptomyces sp. H27-H1]
MTTAPLTSSESVSALTLGSGSGSDSELDVDRRDPAYRGWLREAVRKVQADGNRSADTHLLTVPLPAEWGIDLYLKDESTHPTGSLKHRLARSLFLYALCNGWVRPGRPVIEASSGSTAVSEAYFAKLIGVPFVAVMARTTARSKIDLIEFHGGTCHLVDNPCEVYEVSARLAAETGGHYMDQFTYAERATDWRGNNNIADSIFRQLEREPHPEPAWIVAAAGTGGTSATLARYVHYTQRATGICVADPENSAFFGGWLGQDPSVTTTVGSRIEGIGRQRVEPSFILGAVDRMMRVPDAASIATIRVLEGILGRKCGASTGTGVWAAFKLVSEMKARGERGSVVTLLCDPGERYLDKYYSDGWLAEQGIDIAPYQERVERFLLTGELNR